jgi:hypothetical protein
MVKSTSESATNRPATYVSGTVETETANLCAVLMRTMYGNAPTVRPYKVEKAAAIAKQIERLIAAHVASVDGRMLALETLTREGLHKIGNDITEHFTPKPAPFVPEPEKKLPPRAATVLQSALARCGYNAGYRAAIDLINDLAKHGYEISRIYNGNARNEPS